MDWWPWGVVRHGPPKTAGRLTTNGWVSTQQVARETGELESPPARNLGRRRGEGGAKGRDRARVPGCTRRGSRVRFTRGSSAGPRLRAAWATTGGGPRRCAVRAASPPNDQARVPGCTQPGPQGARSRGGGSPIDQARAQGQPGSQAPGYLWSGRASAWVRVVDLIVMASSRSGTGSGRVVRGVKVRLSVSSRAGSARSWT